MSPVFLFKFFLLFLDLILLILDVHNHIKYPFKCFRGYTVNKIGHCDDEFFYWVLLGAAGVIFALSACNFAFSERNVGMLVQRFRKLDVAYHLLATVGLAIGSGFYYFVADRFYDEICSKDDLRYCYSMPENEYRIKQATGILGGVLALLYFLAAVLLLINIKATNNNHPAQNTCYENEPVKPSTIVAGAINENPTLVIPAATTVVIHNHIWSPNSAVETAEEKESKSF